MEKEVQDTMDEKLFAWLKLPDDFSTLSNKCTHTNNLLPDFDYTSIAMAKTKDFLTNKEKVYLASTIDNSPTSDKILMKGIEEYEMPLVLV